MKKNIYKVTAYLFLAFILQSITIPQGSNTLHNSTASTLPFHQRDKILLEKTSTISSDLDSDHDTIPDDLEINGYTVAPSTNTIVAWNDDYTSRGWPKYVSNPLDAHTAGDPYSDSEKVLGQMPLTDSVARNPLVAAFPAVGISLENFMLSEHDDFITNKIYTASSSKSRPISANATFLDPLPGTPSGGVSDHFLGTDTSSSVWTDISGTDLQIHPGEGAYFDGEIRFYNNGTSAIYQTSPTTQISVGAAGIATVTPPPTEDGDTLAPGASYPEKTQRPIRLSTLSQFDSNPIPINSIQYQAIDEYEQPLLLRTTQIEGTLGRYDSDGTLVTEESWTPYLESIAKKTATIIVDTGEEQIEQRIAGRDPANPSDTTPEITLKEALKRAFAVTENTDGTLSYQGRDMTETNVTIIYDSNTSDLIKNSAGGYQNPIYPIKLQPGMKFLILLPDLIDSVEKGSDLFDPSQLTIEGAGNGINASQAYYSNTGNGALALTQSSKIQLEENHRYLFSAYVKLTTEQGELSVSMGNDTNPTTKTFSLTSDWTKIQMPMDVFEVTDLTQILFTPSDSREETPFYLDNISFTLLGSLTYGDNQMLNPEFEQGFDQWTTNGGNFTIQERVGPLKESAVMFYQTGNAPAELTQSVSVQQSTDYVLSFDINIGIGADALRVEVGSDSGETKYTKELSYLEAQGLNQWHRVSIPFSSGFHDQYKFSLIYREADPISDYLATNFQIRKVNPDVLGIDDYIDFNGKEEEAKKWANEQFEKWEEQIDDDTKQSIQHITEYPQKNYTINKLLMELRNKMSLLDGATGDYTDYYDEIMKIDEAADLEQAKLDKSVLLYVKATPEDFNIAADQIFDPNMNMFQDFVKSIFENRLFGTYNGYPVGGLANPDFQLGDLAIFKIQVPVGTKLIRIDEDKFALQRGINLYFESMNFIKVSGLDCLEITVTLDPPSDINIETKRATMETKINNAIIDKYGLLEEADVFTLDVNGLNSHNTILLSPIIIMEALANIPDDIVANALTELSLTGGKIYITDGNISELSFFNEDDIDSILNFEDDGLTQFNPDTGILVTGISTMFNITNIKYMFMDTLIHEFAHAIDFQHNNEGISNMPEMNTCFNGEKVALSNLLGNDYAQTDVHEFYAEAFKAKFHPDTAIRNEFPNVCPQTNTLLNQVFQLNI